MHNSTDAGSSSVEIKYNQLHFAVRMAQLQPNSSPDSQPFTRMSNVTVVSKVTNKREVPERWNLKISHSQNVKLLQFILRPNVVHKLPGRYFIKALPDVLNLSQTR